VARVGPQRHGRGNYEISICGMGCELSQFYKILANNFIHKYYMHRIIMVITFMYITYER